MADELVSVAMLGKVDVFTDLHKEPTSYMGAFFDTVAVLIHSNCCYLGGPLGL